MFIIILLLLYVNGICGRQYIMMIERFCTIENTCDFYDSFEHEIFCIIWISYLVIIETHVK